MWFKAVAEAAKCFFNWPMLWTRVMCVGSVIATFFLLFKIQSLDHDNSLQRSIADSCMWLIMFIVLGYSGKQTGAVLLQILAARFGIKLPETKGKKEKSDELPNSPG